VSTEDRDERPLAFERVPMMHEPPARRCACKSWDAADCMRIRCGSSIPFDPDDDDYPYTSGERCECFCHVDFEEESED